MKETLRLLVNLINVNLGKQYFASANEISTHLQATKLVVCSRFSVRGALM